MAARAVGKSINWSALSPYINQQELSKINKLKSQCDATVAKVASLPDSLPKIDWAHYKAQTSNPKLVEELEKKYSAIKINVPKPPPTRMNTLREARQFDEDRLKKFSVYCQSYVESAEVVKKKFEDMIPVENMNMEDYSLTFPDWNPTIENPSLWPHEGRTPGLSREEAAAFDQPDPIPFATKTAWKEWEERRKKFY